MAAHLFAELMSSFTGESVGRGVVVDVSLEGVAIDTEAGLAIGDQVMLHIEMPLRILATVMRRDNVGQVKRYGFKFKNQSIFDRFFFKRLLKGKMQTRKLK